MSKEIDILTALYPSGIVAKDICEVYETVMPKIRQLIDGVAVGYAHTGTLSKPTDVLSKVRDTVIDAGPANDSINKNAVDTVGVIESVRVAERDDIVGVTIDKPASVAPTQEQETPGPDSIDEWAKRKYEEVTPPAVALKVSDDIVQGDYPVFIETLKHESTDGWHAEEYNKCKYWRKGDDIVIRIGNSRIDTTWQYLCDFFDDLGDETKRHSIGGVNGPKRTALIEFYIAHPNFACEMIKDGVTKIFKKIDVRVGMATHGENEGARIEDYEVSAY